MKALRDFAQYWELLGVMFPAEFTHPSDYVAVIDRLLVHTQKDVAAMPPGAGKLLDILIADGKWNDVLANTSMPHELAAVVIRAWQLTTFTPIQKKQAGPKKALHSWIGLEVDFTSPESETVERINTAMFAPNWEAVAGFSRGSGPITADRICAWISAIRQHTPPFMPGAVRGVAISQSVALPDLGHWTNGYGLE